MQLTKTTPHFVNLNPHLGGLLTARRSRTSPQQPAFDTDQVTISAAGQQAATRGTASATGVESPFAHAAHRLTQQLSPEEQRLVEELRRRDREVRAHELAHLAAAGPHARGGAKFSYQVGPDGRRYAVGGEVPIDVSEVPGNPRATLHKAQAIRRAALAPAHPSSADHAIAAKATRLEAKAQQELLTELHHGRQSIQHIHAAGEPCDVCMSQPKATTEAAIPDGGQVRPDTGSSHVLDSRKVPEAFAPDALQHYQVPVTPPSRLQVSV